MTRACVTCGASLAGKRSHATTCSSRCRQALKRRRLADERGLGSRCYWCDVAGVELEVEHLEPRAAGGTDDPSNVVAACRWCNAARGSRSPEAFARSSRRQLRRVRDRVAQLEARLAAVRASLELE